MGFFRVNETLLLKNDVSRELRETSVVFSVTNIFWEMTTDVIN